MAGRLLPEMLEDMANKAYPFETTYKYPLSTSAFTDMLITTIGVSDGSTIYVRRLVGGVSEVLLYLGIYSREQTTTLEDPIVVPKTDKSFNPVDFIINADTIQLYGHITTGVREVVYDIVGDSGDLDHTSLPIYSGCVVPIDNTAVGVLVNDIRMTNDIRLVAGDGINITPIIKDGTPYINISIADFVPAENMEITTDSELLQRITAEIGQPITTINGCSPVNGNFIVRSANSDNENDDVLSITTVATADGILEINVPAVTACAVDIQTAAAAFTSSVSNLADRVVALDQFTTALETAVNFLNQQLAQLR